MIHVDQKNPVETVYRQLRIVGFAQLDRNVFKPLALHPSPKPLQRLAADVLGQNPAILIQQWNGKNWEIKSDWSAADTALVRPLIEQDAAQYAKENNITLRSCS